jgi:hypothetical protein
MRQVIHVEVTSKTQWQVGRSGNSDRFVAVCGPLGLTMEGEGLDELAANVNEAVQLLLTSLLESGELQAFLKRHGWRASAPIVDPHDVEFDVPIPLLVNPARDSARALLQ